MTQLANPLSPDDLIAIMRQNARMKLAQSGLGGGDAAPTIDAQPMASQGDPSIPTPPPAGDSSSAIQQLAATLPGPGDLTQRDSWPTPGGMPPQSDMQGRPLAPQLAAAINGTGAPQGQVQGGRVQIAQNPPQDSLDAIQQLGRRLPTAAPAAPAGVMRDANGDPTTPGAQAIEDKMAAMDKAGSDLDTAAQNLAGGGAPFRQGLEDVNAQKRNLAGTMYGAAGAPPMSPLDVTKELGGSWPAFDSNGNLIMTGPKDVGSMQPGQVRDPLTGLTANDPMFASQLQPGGGHLDPRPIAATPGSMHGGDFIPDAGTTGKNPAVSAPENPAQTKQQMDARMAAVLNQEANPRAQAAQMALDSQKANAQGLINKRAELGANLRNLEGAGLNPGQAMGADMQQKLMDSLNGSGGQGGAAQGGLPPWQLQMLDPNLAQGMRENAQIGTQQQAAQNLADSNYMMRRDQRDKDRATNESDLLRGGADPEAAKAAAARNFPPLPQLPVHGAQGAPQQLPPPPAAGNGAPPQQGGAFAPQEPGQKPAVDLSPLITADPEQVANVARGIADPDKNVMLDKLAQRPEVLNNPALLKGVVQKLGITEPELNDLEFQANPHAHNWAGRNLGGQQIEWWMSTPAKRAAAAQRLRSIVAIRKATGSHSPYPMMGADSGFSADAYMGGH